MLLSPFEETPYNLGSFSNDNKPYERNARINRNFSPILGMNMTLKKNISVTLRHNRNKTLDESPMAYRDVGLIKRCLNDSVVILEQLKPIINVKGF